MVVVDGLMYISWLMEKNEDWSIIDVCSMHKTCFEQNKAQEWMMNGT